MVWFWKSRRRREMEILMSNVKQLLTVALETAMELKANTVEVSGKLDQILTQLEDLKNAGGATEEELQGLVDALTDASTTLQSVEDKQDQVLNAPKISADAVPALVSGEGAAPESTEGEPQTPPDENPPATEPAEETEPKPE